MINQLLLETIGLIISVTTGDIFMLIETFLITLLLSGNVRFKILKRSRNWIMNAGNEPKESFHIDKNWNSSIQ